MSKELAPIDLLRQQLAGMKSQIRKALPGHISTEKFTRVLMTAVGTSPDLVSANRDSLFGACLKLAQQGLMPDGKEAAIVTFNTKGGAKVAQAMPMVSGILKLVRNSGELASITPNVVYENDVFKYWVDENGDHLKHEPDFVGDRGEMTLAYCIAKTKDGAVYIEVMSKSEIEKVRNSSRAKGSGPWTSWYEEMARKTVIRRLAKRLPMSTDLDDVVRADDDMYELDPQPEPPAEEQAATATPPKDPKKPNGLKDAMKTVSEPPQMDDSEPLPDAPPPKHAPQMDSPI